MFTQHLSVSCSGHIHADGDVVDSANKEEQCCLPLGLVSTDRSAKASLSRLLSLWQAFQTQSSAFNGAYTPFRVVSILLTASLFVMQMEKPGRRLQEPCSRSTGGGWCLMRLSLSRTLPPSWHMLLTHYRSTSHQRGSTDLVMIQSE